MQPHECHLRNKRVLCPWCSDCPLVAPRYKLTPGNALCAGHGCWHCLRRNALCHWFPSFPVSPCSLFPLPPLPLLRRRHFCGKQLGSSPKPERRILLRWDHPPKLIFKQWWIQDLPDRDLKFGQNFPENCMKIKDIFGPRGGVFPSPLP